MTGRDRVFVDANELLPFSVMDLLLLLAEDLLIDFVWSDELIDEWERVIVREGRRTSETARAVSDAVRRFFATTRIDPLAYRFSSRSPRQVSLSHSSRSRLTPAVPLSNWHAASR